MLSSLYGTGSGANYGTATISAAAGDIISLRNCTGSPVVLSNVAGGTKKAVSASIFLTKVGANIKPDAILETVNAAKTSDEMRTAITER